MNQREVGAFAMGEREIIMMKTTQIIYFSPVLGDDALTHLLPLCLARWHGVAQLENNGRSPSSGCSLHPMPAREGVIQRPPRGLKQQQLAFEKPGCIFPATVAINTHVHTHRNPSE